jgi:DNA-binding beta-propeller fold protein YncE
MADRPQVSPGIFHSTGESLADYTAVSMIVFTRPFARRSAAGGLAVLLLGSACNSIVGNSDGVYVRPKISTLPDGGSVLEGYTLTLVSGQNQSGEVGAPLAQPLTVEARDPEGKPATGFTVRFRATAGGGYFLDPSSPTVGADGRAQIRFALGPAEKNVIDATLEKTSAKATASATSNKPWQVSIYAGLRVGRMFQDGNGTGARFAMPRGLTAHANGYLTIADEYGNAVRRFDTRSKELTTLAGLLAPYGSRAEGIGSEARFTSVLSVATEGDNRVLAAGFGSNTIHRIELDSGKVTFLAGSGIEGTRDDVGTKAQFRFPRGVAVDSRGGRAFVADTSNDTIRQVDLATGAVTTLAGSPGQGGAVDGVGSIARFYHATDLAYDGNDTLYIADYGGRAIRALTISSKNVTTFAGKLVTPAYVDGPGSTARFLAPHFIAYDAGRKVLYVTDQGGHSVRRVTIPASGEPEVSTLVGSAPPQAESGTNDGVGNDARLFWPSGVTVTPTGDALYVTDQSAVLKRVDLTSLKVETVAGASCLPKDGDGKTQAVFDGPYGLGEGTAGALLVADNHGNSIRRIDAAGQVSTVAGPMDESEDDVDDTGAAVRFRSPRSVLVEGPYLYVTEAGHAVRRVAVSDGTTTTVAGVGGKAGFAEGPGDTALFRDPVGLTLNAATGELYVADIGNHRIRAIDLASRVVRTLVGGSQGAEDGSGGVAKFNLPFGMALVGGALYVADTHNHAIRSIDLASGNVTTIAGALGQFGSEDGLGSEARFNSPIHIVGSGDFLYVADHDNHAIRRIHLPSRTVSTLLGGGGSGYGVGALPVKLTRPRQLLVRPSGEVFFTLYGENAVFRLGPPP